METTRIVPYLVEHKIKHNTAGIHGQIVKEMKKVSHYANIENKH